MPNSAGFRHRWLRECGVSETPEEVASYFDRLWPLLRSLTGEGVRRTHDILAELAPLTRLEIASGTPCFDWVVPQEWRCRQASLRGPNGNTVLDIQTNNLHLVNYSVGFRGELTRDELDAHLHSLPDLPDAVPYVTSYYERRWGFCLSQRMREALPEGKYQVVIDAEHFDGSMTLSHVVLPGDGPDEVLISAYTCHPSMANNELSGPLVAAFLCRRLAALKRRRLTYRFVWLPETIGSLAYLSRYGDHLARRLAAGYVVSCLGDRAALTYKRSRRTASLADRAAAYVLPRTEAATRIIDFAPTGSDERQYCSPGFDLPVGVVARSIYGTYREYHTSLDDRSFVCFDSLIASIDACVNLLGVLDDNVRYRRTLPYGEPQLGRRGLYPTIGGPGGSDARLAALRWVLNLADGGHDLLAMAERSGIEFAVIHEAAQRCLEAGLIEPHPAAERDRASLTQAN